MSNIERGPKFIDEDVRISHRKALHRFHSLVMDVYYTLNVYITQVDQGIMDKFEKNG